MPKTKHDRHPLEEVLAPFLEVAAALPEDMLDEDRANAASLTAGDFRRLLRTAHTVLDADSGEVR